MRAMPRDAERREDCLRTALRTLPQALAEAAQDRCRLRLRGRTRRTAAFVCGNLRRVARPCRGAAGDRARARRCRGADRRRRGTVSDRALRRVDRRTRAGLAVSAGHDHRSAALSRGDGRHPAGRRALAPIVASPSLVGRDGELAPGAAPMLDGRHLERLSPTPSSTATVPQGPRASLHRARPRSFGGEVDATLCRCDRRTAIRDRSRSLSSSSRRDRRRGPKASPSRIAAWRRTSTPSTARRASRPPRPIPR